MRSGKAGQIRPASGYAAYEDKPHHKSVKIPFCRSAASRPAGIGQQTLAEQPLAKWRRRSNWWCAMPTALDKLALRRRAGCSRRLVFRPEGAGRATEPPGAAARTAAWPADAGPAAHPRRSARADRAGLAQYRGRLLRSCRRRRAAGRSPRCAAPGDFFADLAAVEERRHGAPSERLLREAPPGNYPRYYLQKFHFQSDGYLSDASAARYDHQVEVLFGGGAAAMRRQALVPLQTRARPKSRREARRRPAPRPRLRHRQLSARGQGELAAAACDRARPVAALPGCGAARAGAVVAHPPHRGSGRGDAVRRRRVRRRHLRLSVSRIAAARSPGGRRRDPAGC